MKPTHHILISLITLLLPITARAEEKATPAAAAPTAQQRAEFIEGLLKAADTKPLVFPASSLSRMEYNARLAKWAERKLLPVLNAEIAKLTLDEKQRAEIANIPLTWTRAKYLSDWKNTANVLDEALGTQSDVPVLRFFVSQAEFAAGESVFGIKNLTLMLKEATPATPPILVALAASHLLGQKNLDLLRVREYEKKCTEAL